MKLVLIFILKILATIPIIIAFWVQVVAAVIMWDEYLISSDAADRLWEKKEEKELDQ